MNAEKLFNKVLTVLLALMLLSFSAPAMAEEIEIVGTGDGTRVLESIGMAFSMEHPDVAISVPKSIGSGGGIKAVGNNQNEIGRVARPIKDREASLGLSYAPYAKIPVVFFMHPGTGVKTLTAEQVCAIYSRQVTNWREVGGVNEKIRVVRREDGDSSLSNLLKTFPGFKDIEITDKSKTALKTAEAFSIVESKNGAIGFGPYDIAKQADVEILQVDGKSPTDSSYPSVTTLALIYKAENKRGNLGKFIDFATSAASRNAIQVANGIPIN